MSQVNWQWYQFDQLDTDLLYRVLKLRQDVFILEQQCLYLDLDGKDQDSSHLIGTLDGEVVAYLRVLSKDINQQTTMVIGRVLTHASQRGTGAGKTLLQKTLDYLADHYPDLPVQLSAQLYLQRFYESFGFAAISEPYDEDGIMHIDMHLMV